MKSFPVLSETLTTLYVNGEISAAALTAIAPIKWLAQHYPEFLKSSDKLVEILNALEQPTTIAPHTCKDCIHFSSVHKCCTTRIDQESTYLPVTSQSATCQDFEGVELPTFVNRGPQ